MAVPQEVTPLLDAPPFRVFDCLNIIMLA